VRICAVSNSAPGTRATPSSFQGCAAASPEGELRSNQRVLRPTCGSVMLTTRALATFQGYARLARRRSATPAHNQKSPGAGLALLLLRSSLSAYGGVGGYRGADELFESGFVDLLAFAEVDRTARVPLEAGVEQLLRVFERGSAEKGELHDLLVRFPGADAAVMVPNGGSPPFPLLLDVGVGIVDELTDVSEGGSSPIAKLSNPLGDVRRRGRAIGTTCGLHVVIYLRAAPCIVLASLKAAPQLRLKEGLVSGCPCHGVRRANDSFPLRRRSSIETYIDDAAISRFSLGCHAGCWITWGDFPEQSVPARMKAGGVTFQRGIETQLILRFRLSAFRKKTRQSSSVS
jgi:hypothetical protein